MDILLIAGHGGNPYDVGACSGNYQEAKLTRELVKLLKTELSSYATVTIFDTNKNMYQYLKSNSFNFKKYDYVVELHFNAFNGNASGTEVLVHTTEKGIGVETAICQNLAKLGFKNRGVKRRSDLRNMNICKKTQGVSYALIETCFIDSKTDMAIYGKNKAATAKAIARGIIDGFGLKDGFTAQKKALQTKAGLTADEINYIANYKNAQTLINKLATAIK